MIDWSALNKESVAWTSTNLRGASSQRWGRRSLSRIIMIEWVLSDNTHTHTTSTDHIGVEISCRNTTSNGTLAFANLHSSLCFLNKRRILIKVLAPTRIIAVSTSSCWQRLLFKMTSSPSWRHHHGRCWTRVSSERLDSLELSDVRDVVWFQTSAAMHVVPGSWRSRKISSGQTDRQTDSDADLGRLLQPLRVSDSW
jgi:hypothetical protein